MIKYIVQTYGVATWQYEVEAKNKEEAEENFLLDREWSGELIDTHDEQIEFVREIKDDTNNL